MSLYDNIADAKERHSQILAELNALQDAPETLESHKAFLSHLSRQITDTDHRLKEVGKCTKIGRERHERYRDSTMRRLMYRASGKRAEFEEKADDEMRSYYSALEQENQTRAQREMLELQSRETMQDMENLKAACAKRAKLEDELETMYERLFSGPTAEFPEEDAQEEAVKAARTHHRGLSKELSNRRRALQCLAKAQVTIKEALLYLFEAQKSCERDMLGFGGALADFRKQNSLSNAQRKVSQTQILVDQARHFDPNMPRLPSMDIVQVDMISGILCDNIVFNMNYLNMIYDSFGQVKVAEEHLASSFRQTKLREEHLQTKVHETADHLVEAERDLRRVRDEAFMKAADPPPPYTDTPA
ncbi:hypothetical protein BJY01DRAFT_217926 [Aspergillus pseudoustus]|uniref:Uncharacterized protein n=1 Tax=Aspergillus pseudoustus TaxID=1810923 RepID=A0ABR4JLU0_9EURO